uniref:Uncharacterized protein n=1 Tax=Triticum urartu TaxID=4572 RepID=A0A8R7Q4N1_TRIUA
MGCDQAIYCMLIVCFIYICVLLHGKYRLNARLEITFYLCHPEGPELIEI